MKKWYCIFFIIGFACQNQATKTEVKSATEVVATIDDLNVVDYDGLKPYLHKRDNSVHVINFWATWCAPCVKELPYFEKLHDTYKNENIEILLVSLDFPSKYESKLLPFIRKNELKSEIIALDDTDQNRWIPAIDQNWSGAIPATIIYNGEKRKFYEKSFTQEELNTEIEQFLN